MNAGDAATACGVGQADGSPKKVDATRPQMRSCPAFNPAMSDLHFPSGPWTGFFTYTRRPGKHRMDLSLTFENGRITGDGADAVGLFVIAGSFDAGSGGCDWAKIYPRSHDVAYRGFCEEKGIWGTWEIHGWWRGGFHIWPVGDEHCEELELVEEEPVEEAIGAPRR